MQLHVEDYFNIVVSISYILYICVTAIGIPVSLPPSMSGDAMSPSKFSIS